LGKSVVVLLMATAARHNTVAFESNQNDSSAPSMKAKDSIIAMVIASSIDGKGQVVNPTFTFSPNEPQITAIVYVGTTSGSQLKITWFKTSEKGDERLFEHQIQVKSTSALFP